MIRRTLALAASSSSRSARPRTTVRDPRMAATRRRLGKERESSKLPVEETQQKPSGVKPTRTRTLTRSQPNTTTSTTTSSSTAMTETTTATTPTTPQEVAAAPTLATYGIAGFGVAMGVTLVRALLVGF